MAGLYVHIPFCKQICHYCDFYKTATLKYKSEFLEALIKEIVLKKDYIDEPIETLYFGGGSPSVLNCNDLNKILDCFKNYYKLNTLIETTIEVNPDDLSFDYLFRLKKIGFNRLSIGVQSFNDEVLKYLSRRHNAETALNAINDSFGAGFDNISIDLIYGIPGQTFDMFSKDLEFVSALKIKHLSAYHLGIEDKTYFGKIKALGKIKEIKESDSKTFFDLLINWAVKTGFEHYEISNLALNKHYSLHNSNYWSFKPYIGFGPSAHSYFDNKRSYNVSYILKYIEIMNNPEPIFETELLNTIDIKNEYLLLRLRTMWGIKLKEMNVLFSESEMRLLLRRLDIFIESNHIRYIDDSYILTSEGFFISDFIIRELMF